MSSPVEKEVTYWQSSKGCDICTKVDAHPLHDRTVISRISRTGPRTTWTVLAGTTQLLEPRLSEPVPGQEGSSLIPDHVHDRCAGHYQASGLRCTRRLANVHVQYPPTFTGVGQVCFQTLKSGDRATYTLIRFFCNIHAKAQGFIPPQSPPPGRFNPKAFPSPNVPPTLGEKVKRLIQDFDAEDFYARHAESDEDSMTLSRRSMNLELERLFAMRNAYTNYLDNKPGTTDSEREEPKKRLNAYFDAQAKSLVTRRIRDDDEQQKKLNKICKGAPGNFAWDGPDIIWESRPSPPAAETQAPAANANAPTTPAPDIIELDSTPPAPKQTGESEPNTRRASAQRRTSAKSNTSTSPRKRKSSSESSEPASPTKKAKHHRS